MNRSTLSRYSCHVGDLLKFARNCLLIFVVAIGMVAPRAEALPVTLINDFETTVETSECSSNGNGVVATFVTSGTGITHGSKALQLRFVASATGWPTETISFNAQDWSNSGALAMDVYNSGTTDTTISVRMDDPLGNGSSHCLTGTATIKAGTAAKVAFPLYSSSVLSQLATALGFKNGVPGAYKAYQTCPTAFWSTPGPDLTQMRKVRIFIGSTNPTPDRTLVFDNLHLVPGPTYDYGLYTENITDFETATEQSSASYTSGVAYSYVNSPGVTSGSYALKMDYLGNSGVAWPYAEFPLPDLIGLPAGADWLGRNGIALAADVTNTGTVSVPFFIQVRSQNNTYQYGMATISPNATNTYLFPLVGVKGLGITGFTDMSCYGSFEAFDFQHLAKISYCYASGIPPSSTITLYFDNLRLVIGDLLAKTVDGYGQNNRIEWSGKRHGNSEFPAQRDAEASDLAANPVLPGRDIFGGWSDTGAPQLTPGTYFRTEQVNGKWWLVDPAGRIFWGVGMATMDSQSVRTFISGGTGAWLDRSGMFAQLPPSTGSDYSQFWGTYQYGGAPFQGWGNTYNHYRANLFRKYGSTFQSQWTTTALARTKSWGFNMIGAWAESSLAPNSQVPYTLIFSTASTTYKTLSTVSGAMPDVWDPQFATSLLTSFASAASTSNDPWLIGYFVDNELGWGTTAYGDNYHYPVVYAAMLKDARVANTSPAKDNLILTLQSRYSSISALNTAWGTAFTGWTDPVLLNAYTLPSTLNAAQRGDFDAFLSSYATRYFSQVRTALKSVDPNHLYLGCRFAANSTPVTNAASQYCDVVSFNIYQLTVDSSWNFLDLLGKPCCIGEFHFGATDRGGFAGGGVVASNQVDRAAKYQAYVASAMAHSSIVACNWFQYIDEPITGRIWDGENSAIGFVDVTDTPYPEMVSAARTVNATIYTNRY